MEWIRVEPPGDITLRESELTSIWSCITREFGQPPEERRQMTAVVTLTGALSDRRTARRLQARMVKVVSQPGVRRGTTAFRKERSQGLSGMQGNLHVPFLGGWVGAIPPGYPAVIVISSPYPTTYLMHRCSQRESIPQMTSHETCDTSLLTLSLLKSAPAAPGQTEA